MHTMMSQARLAVLAAAVLLAGGAAAHAQAIDLRGNPGAQKLREVLRALAQGNERDAGFEELSLNVGNGEVKMRAWIRSRHVAGRFLGNDLVVYDWTVRGEAAFNPRTGNVNGQIDFGRGIRISINDVARLLGAAAK